MARDPACVFCRIVEGRAEASLVHHDDLVTAFMDIMPVNEGHVLVVPNEHSQGLEGLSEVSGARMFAVARRLAMALCRSGLRCEGVNLYLADGRAAGQKVFHVHLHVLPRHSGDGFGLRRTKPRSQPSRRELDVVAEGIRRSSLEQRSEPGSVVSIEPLADSDRAWAADLVTVRWGGPQVVSRGRLHDVRNLPGLVAWRETGRVGLATYHLDETGCELVTLDALEKGRGIGTALLRAVEQAARQAGCRRLWLITTNDNVEAQRFYQRRGFRLAALHVGAIQVSRGLKPGIAEVGAHGIPVRDELELELALEETVVG